MYHCYITVKLKTLSLDMVRWRPSALMYVATSDWAQAMPEWVGEQQQQQQQSCIRGDWHNTWNDEGEELPSDIRCVWRWWELKGKKESRENSCTAGHHLWQSDQCLESCWIIFWKYPYHRTSSAWFSYIYVVRPCAQSWGDLGKEEEMEGHLTILKSLSSCMYSLS